MVFSVHFMMISRIKSWVIVATLSLSLENEQKTLKETIPGIEEYISTASVKKENLQQFIDKAKRITRLKELTPEIVHEFIEKIVVSKAEYIDGLRHQSIAVYYKGVGIIKFFSAEEMESLYQKHINRKQAKEKTAYHKLHREKLIFLLQKPPWGTNFLMKGTPSRYFLL